MEKIVTVAGVHRFAINYLPNIIQCDVCGAEKIMGRIHHIRETAALDGWAYIDGDDFCPDCNPNDHIQEDT